MVVYNSMADGESQSGALVAGFCGEEGIEDTVQDFRRDARAMILDRCADPGTAIFLYQGGGDVDDLVFVVFRVAAIKGFAGVGEEVQEDLLDLLGAAFDGGKIVGDIGQDGDLVVFDHGADENEGIGDNVGDSGGAVGLFFITGKGQEVLDDASDAFAFVDDFEGELDEAGE